MFFLLFDYDCHGSASDVDPSEFAYIEPAGKAHTLESKEEANNEQQHVKLESEEEANDEQLHVKLESEEEANDEQLHVKLESKKEDDAAMSRDERRQVIKLSRPRNPSDRQVIKIRPRNPINRLESHPSNPDVKRQRR